MALPQHKQTKSQTKQAKYEIPKNAYEKGESAINLDNLGTFCQIRPWAIYIYDTPEILKSFMAHFGL